MGSDDDAMMRRNAIESRWSWLRGKWDPSNEEAEEGVREREEQFIRDQEQADEGLIEELRWDEIKRQVEAEGLMVWKVDMGRGMRHDDGLGDAQEKGDDRGDGMTMDVIEAAEQVLPEPMIDYLKLNRTRDGEFDEEPGFWATLRDAGTPMSWFDATQVRVDDTGKMTRVSRVDQEIGEAQRRGVPLMAGLTEEAMRALAEAEGRVGGGRAGDLPVTASLPVIEPTMVLPAVKDDEAAVAVDEAAVAVETPKRTPRGGQRAARARDAAQKRWQDRG